MTPDYALQYLAQLSVEYLNQFKDMPATREGIAVHTKQAIDVLRAAIQGGENGAPSA
jgi:hypothetical protein